MSMEDLTTYYKNVYSQRGEDGILEEIFKRLNLTNGTFVEFGSSDGITNSNSKNLVNKNWNGCFIESNIESFKKLKEHYNLNKNILCINKKVEEQGINSLDFILDSDFNKKIDLISIDIDGEDYDVFKSINKYLPKLFLIECNPYRYPLDENYYGYNHRHVQESFYLFNKIAESKNYRLLCYTQNIFFIKNEYFNLFNVSEDLMYHFKSGLKILLKYEDKDVFNRVYKKTLTVKNHEKIEKDWFLKIVKEL